MPGVGNAERERYQVDVSSTVCPGSGARGAFREVVPVRRLAYSFGWEGDEEVPPGSGLVEIDLTDRQAGLRAIY